MVALQQSTEVTPDEIARIVGNRTVIVASNRGPVEFHREADGRLATRRGSGGLVTALAALARDLPLTWVATAMSAGDHEAFPNEAAPAREVRLERHRLRVRYVGFPADVYRSYYDEISNELLWFLQHYLWNPAYSPIITSQQYTAWEHGYRQVNQALACAIIQEALAREQATAGKRPRAADGSNALILIQDYHLYLAAARVRERLPRATVQQFIHIPWPAIRYWQFLPERLAREIYEGLAANDVLGFQTDRDASNFLECARAFLPGSRIDLEQGRLTWRRHRLLARAYPVTVDAGELRRALTSAAGRQAATELAPLLREEGQVIVRVDRLDPTKNIVRGFMAYDELLRRYPELRGTVRFLAFLVPSRQSLGIYRQYERGVRRIIKRINAAYGTPDWQPITVFFDNNRARALMAMRRYDVLLVNPVIDGMNLVAKEGPLVNEHDGVLVLSRTAGAFQQLGELAQQVTATDIEETTEQLREALAMPTSERRQRSARMRALIEGSSPLSWVLDQLRDAVESRRTR